MTFGTKLKLEGRSPKSPEWGVFKSIMIAAETCGETSGSATERVRHYLDKQAMMWQQNYDLELQFRIVEVSRVIYTASQRIISQALSQPIVNAREVMPASLNTAYPRRQQPTPAPTAKPPRQFPKPNTSYSAIDRRHS